MSRRALLLLALPLLGGCATKRDLRDLRTEMTAMRMAQDSAFREVQRQNRMMLDSLTRQEIRTRGDLANRMLQVERQVVQVQEVTGQGQQRLAEIREQLNDRARDLETRAAEQPDGAPTPTDPQQLYDASLASLRRGSLATARAGFQEFLRLNPRHRLAADAQFHLGESYLESDPEQALAAYARVVEQFPTSPRAATALYRAGTLEAGRGNAAQARALFGRVIQNHGQSPEAPLARQELQKLGRR